jgi:predicted metal-dependent phosphoesterase TrpH
MTLRVEFHCHTLASKDSLARPEDLLAACVRKGIDRLVITDHNTIAGARRAKELDPERVIIGEEIMTTGGELLAAFVEEEVPPGLSPQETINILREQGALISVAHPFDLHRKGHWELPVLKEIVPRVDAIEIFNARCMSPRFNTEAQAFAREQSLRGTAGSDAHAVFELGRGIMVLPDFEGASGLASVLGQACFETRLSSPFVHLTSRYAVWYKKLVRMMGTN